MPELDATIHEPYADDEVLVFGIYREEDPSQIQDFVEQTGVGFPVLGDDASTLNMFEFPGGVGYPYPRDVVIGKDLRVRSIRNSFNADEMTALVQQLLAE